MSASEGRSINLDTMSLDQLNSLKEQQEEQLQGLTNRYGTLRAAAARLQASNEAVSSLTSDCDQKSVMVPLTSSLYVPAKIVEPNNLLVELGTGFFVEKSTSECCEFLQRKLELVDANSENVTKAIQGCRQNVDSIQMAMQGQLVQIKARSEGRRAMQSSSED